MVSDPREPSASRATRHDNPGTPQTESTISEIDSSLSERLESLTGGSQTNVSEQGGKAKLRAQRQVNSMQKKEEDEVKATLPPPTIVSPNASQSSALKRSPKSEENPEVVRPKEEPFTSPKLLKLLKVLGLVQCLPPSSV